MSGLPPQPIQRTERQDSNRWLFLLLGAILGAGLVTGVVVWQRGQQAETQPPRNAPEMVMPMPHTVNPDASR